LSAPLDAYHLRLAMNASTSAGSIRIALEIRTCRSSSRAQSPYTVAVETPKRAATEGPRVWVAGPWEAISPAGDVDEVID